MKQPRLKTPHDLNDNEEFEVGDDFILDIVQEGTIVAIRGVPSDDELFNLFRVDGIVTTYQILEDHYGIDIEWMVSSQYIKYWKITMGLTSSGWYRHNISNTGRSLWD